MQPLYGPGLWTRGPIEQMRLAGNICLPHGVYGCSSGDCGDDAPEISSGHREEEAWYKRGNESFELRSNTG